MTTTDNRYSVQYASREERAATQLRNAERFAALYHAGQIDYDEAFEAVRTQIGRKRAVELLGAKPSA